MRDHEILTIKGLLLVYYYYSICSSIQNASIGGKSPHVRFSSIKETLSFEGNITTLDRHRDFEQASRLWTGIATLDRHRGFGQTAQPGQALLISTRSLTGAGVVFGLRQRELILYRCFSFPTIIKLDFSHHWPELGLIENSRLHDF